MAARVVTTTRAAGTTTRAAGTTTRAATDFISVCRTRTTATAAADRAVADAQAQATRLNTDATAAATKLNTDATAAATKINADAKVAADRTISTAKASADKTIADAKAQADALVKTATDNRTAITTALTRCPVPPTPGDLTAMNGTFNLDTATATLTIPGNGRRWVRSTRPLTANANAYVSFQMTGPGTLGYTFYIGFSENPAANNQLAVGNIGTTLLLGFSYDVNARIIYTYIYNGNDGDGGFIQMQNPYSNQAHPNGAPGTAMSRWRRVTDNNSTFIVHFDGTNHNFYHNSRLVHSQAAPRGAPRGPLSLYMSTDGDNLPVRITNLIYGNAPSAADIQGFARTLPQTGGRRRNKRNNRKSRRGGRRMTRRGTRRTA